MIHDDIFQELAGIMSISNADGDMQGESIVAETFEIGLLKSDLMIFERSIAEIKELLVVPPADSYRRLKADLEDLSLEADGIRAKIQVLKAQHVEAKSKPTLV